MKPIISQQAIEDSKGEQKEKSDFKLFYTVPQREYESVFPALGGRNVLFFPDNDGGTLRSVNRDAKYMWQALWPISNKYQGDDAD